MTLRNLPAWLIFTFIILSCGGGNNSLKTGVSGSAESGPVATETSLIVLGTIQDAGSPHIACTKECCAALFDNPDPGRRVVSLGLYDNETGKRYLFEATPDMPEQMKALKRFAPGSKGEMADGIFITHAHIGHYTGLMYLGKEAANPRGVPVYVMPLMNGFLHDNAPWNLLVRNGNISPVLLEENVAVKLSASLTVTPLLVPHRDELSETVGFLIEGPTKKALFIPDIDKWHLWEKYIVEEIRKVDYAFIDATFYSGEEINQRDISQIPHPFIIESMELFSDLSMDERGKVWFIHFNHTNPVLDAKSSEARLVAEKGFSIARAGEIFVM